ncbi:uncharacterized protein LOC115737820 [Rhodamnia argentea]|uniref:Uncharacterized protein LOC115737820 n=1 Tax=Rhodamnia argentea TaxID=178133 RepID=A0ABM3HRC7_9MYRT|nr:uncharacterized protein LOC115737820 [Rhodamnia argentea]
MKREKTLLSSSSSSSYRERDAATNATPDGRSCLHSRSIGCMSGLFRLLSRYQHRRKSLTYGKRQQKNILVVSPPAKDGTADLVPALLRDGAAAAAKRISCDVPRSPTLPAEMRRSSSPGGHAAPPPQPTVVARLMGLTAGEAPESASEKRRKLLGALDRCDQDLKALKKIIDVVRSAEELRYARESAKPNASFDGRLQELAKKEGETEGDDDSGYNENSNSREEEEEEEEQQLPPPQQEEPSPVSVLDEFTRSSLISGYSKRHSIAHQARPNNYVACHAERLVPPPQRKKPGEELNYSICLLDRIAYEPSPARARTCEIPVSAPPSRISEVMRQSVDQVCRDIAWGQRREVGRIGLALHDHICRDLIEETVREMGHWCITSSLPFEACKRRLCF